MYKEEVIKMLRELFFESWMDDGDWEEFILELEKETKISIDTLSEQIEIGVKNGYSVEKQTEICKTIFEKLK
jgi:hypothetical protein